MFTLPGVFYLKIVNGKGDDAFTRGTAWFMAVGGMILCPLSLVVITLSKLGILK